MVFPSGTIAADNHASGIFDIIFKTGIFHIAVDVIGHIWPVLGPSHRVITFVLSQNGWISSSRVPVQTLLFLGTGKRLLVLLSSVVLVLKK